MALGLSLCGCQEEPEPATSPEHKTAKDQKSTKEQPSRQLRVPEKSDAPLTSPVTAISAERVEQGWIALFDGQTLFGWRAGGDAQWTVKEGAIVSSSETPGLLLTSSGFHDYELYAEVWIEPGGSSALLLRTVPFPEDPATDCLVFSLDHLAAESSQNVADDWHEILVTVKGPEIRTTINGEPVLRSYGSRYTKTGGARIALRKNEGTVRFRKILLRPLGLDPLWEEGTDQWHVAPEGALLSVEPIAGGVRLQGTGYYESKKTYDDFLLQFEAKINVADANSGLFFRAQPSTTEAPSNGYEMQLQNTIAHGDRTDPDDYHEGFGTGAIFRRQAARYVNADDKEWLHATLLVRGNHMASWINGLQVTDFTDTRPFDDNPRQGRRDKAGQLSLQGHDAKTDISLQKLRLKEFPGSSG